MRQALWKNDEKGYFLWVRMNWSSRGNQLDFEHHKYLQQIYTDQWGNGNGIIVYQKPAQQGLTERLLTEALWVADQKSCNSIYFFPTTSTMGDLVQERIDQPINNSHYLRVVSGRSKVEQNRTIDKVGLKKMSKGFVYFRGSNSASAITSVAGDAIFVDEVDRMMQDNMAYFEKRLEHSELRWQRWASTPTIPLFGINKLFIETDQMFWFTKCPHCGHKESLDFFLNVDKEKGIVFCSKCKKELSPSTLDGEWIAKHPGRENRGYQLNALASPRLNLKKLIKDSNKTSESEIQQFYNQNLGIPYESKGSRINDSDFERCKGSYKMQEYDKGEKIFIGADIGRYIHYVVRTVDRIIDFGSCLNFVGEDSLLEIAKRYDADGVVLDALPETRKSQEFVREFERAKICYYAGMGQLTDVEVYWNCPAGEIKINTDRTVSLDNVFNEFKQGFIQIPSNYDRVPEFATHLKSTTRIIEQDARGVQKAKYVEVGDDHLLHACNYAKLACNVYDVANYEVFTL